MGYVMSFVLSMVRKMLAGLIHDFADNVVAGDRPKLGSKQEQTTVIQEIDDTIADLVQLREQVLNKAVS